MLTVNILVYDMSAPIPLCNDFNTIGKAARNPSGRIEKKCLGRGLKTRHHGGVPLSSV